MPPPPKATQHYQIQVAKYHLEPISNFLWNFDVIPKGGAELSGAEWQKEQTTVRCSSSDPNL